MELELVDYEAPASEVLEQLATPLAALRPLPEEDWAAALNEQ